MWKPDDGAAYWSSQKCWLRAVVVRVHSNGDIKLKVFGSSNSNESRDVTVNARDVATKLRMRLKPGFDRQGRTLRQLRDIHRDYVKTGILREKCAEFNKNNATAIQEKTKFAMGENLYALDNFFVKPKTEERSRSVVCS